jgi:hypothetical protein
MVSWSNHLRDKNLTPHAGIWLNASVAGSLDGPAFAVKQKRLAKSASAKARCRDKKSILTKELKIVRSGKKDFLSCSKDW